MPARAAPLLPCQHFAHARLDTPAAPKEYHQLTPNRERTAQGWHRNPTPPDGEPDAEQSAERNATAEAGIAKVVAFEQAAPNHRHPHVMHPARKVDQFLYDEGWQQAAENPAS